MFESAEVGIKTDKTTYAARVPELREKLLAAQRRLAAAPLSVVVVIGGVEGAGKSETVNLLLEWMDSRGIETHSLWSLTDEEKTRPPAWPGWPPRPRCATPCGRPKAAPHRLPHPRAAARSESASDRRSATGSSNPGRCW